MKYFGCFTIAIVLAFAFAFACVQPLVAHAEMQIAREKPYVVFDAVLKEGAVQINSNEIPPEEPNILQVTYLNLPVINTFELRAERLLHGVSMDIPPEYDHYGYEIRRYMARIGNTAIYEDVERLRTELSNVKKARIVFTYWQKAMDKEMEDLDKQLLEKQVSTIARNAYTKNKSTVRSFMIALQGWIDSNERFLEHALKFSGTYENFYPEIVFTVQGNDHVDFYNNFRAKQARLEAIRKYRPFSMMVY